MKALIIDCREICLEVAEMVLHEEGWEVATIFITPENRENFRITSLEQQLPIELSDFDLLVIGLELGGNVNSIGLACATRKQFPKIPVVLFTEGHIKEAALLDAIGIYHFYKGLWFNMKAFSKGRTYMLKDLKYAEDLNSIAIPKRNPVIPPNDPAWIKNKDYGDWISKLDPRIEEKLPPLWSDLKAVNSKNIASVFELVKNSWVERTTGSYREIQLKNLHAIMGLIDNDAVYDDNECLYSIRRIYPLMHCIGHALCDGYLSLEDLSPFLPGLRKVLQRNEDFHNNSNFRFCATFIECDQPVAHMTWLSGKY